MSTQASLTLHLSSDIRHYSYWPSMTTNVFNPSNPAYIRILQPCCHAHYHPQKESSGSSSRSYHPYINKQCALSLQVDTVKEYKGCQTPDLDRGSGKMNLTSSALTFTETLFSIIRILSNLHKHR